MQNEIPDLSGLQNNDKPAPNKSENENTGHRNVVILVYALQAISLFVGFTALVAIIINYVKKEDVEGTIAESHFRWQIRTFWFGLLWLTIATVTYILLIGYYLLIAATVWYVYRIAKGWLRISENRAMYDK